MTIALITITTLALLYWAGWLTFKKTGVLKPLINLTVLGFAVSIKKPDPDAQ